MATFKVKALLVSMGPIQLGADVRLSRPEADVLQMGDGDTLRIASGTGVTGTQAFLAIPHSTALAGTTNVASAGNGGIMVGRVHASTVALITRLNGTSYWVEVAAI